MPEKDREFEAHRDHLTAVAYRMLGSRADAEDVVQEAWLRWHEHASSARPAGAAEPAAGDPAAAESAAAEPAAAEPTEIRNVRAWLTTVTARICLDQLRSARVRRETYVGQWLPEPVVERLPGTGGGSGLEVDPADRATRTDELSYALLVVLERLSPEQRVAFVLHDVFAVPFDAIAPVLATTPAAARKLASRARRAVSSGEAPRHRTELAEQRRVLAAFLDAAESGDIDGLLAVLAPDAVALGDGGGVAPAARRPVRGALPVARFVAGVFRRFQREAVRQRVEVVLLNGDLGLLVEVALPDGTTLRATNAFAIIDGQLTGVFSQVNPAKLTRVPTTPADAGTGPLRSPLR